MNNNIYIFKTLNFRLLLTTVRKIVPPIIRETRCKQSLFRYFEYEATKECSHPVKEKEMPIINSISIRSVQITEIVEMQMLMVCIVGDLN